MSAPNKCLSDSERQIQIETTLNKINLEVIDISDALLFYNEDILQKDICEILLQIIPNESEFKYIWKKTKNLKIQDFSICDLFIFLIGELAHYKERIEAIIFKLIYNDKSLEISNLINNNLNAFKFIKENLTFHKFLDIIVEQSDIMKNKTIINEKFYHLFQKSMIRKQKIIRQVY